MDQGTGFVERQGRDGVRLRRGGAQLFREAEEQVQLAVAVEDLAGQGFLDRFLIVEQADQPGQRQGQGRLGAAVQPPERLALVLDGKAGLLRIAAVRLPEERLAIQVHHADRLGQSRQELVQHVAGPVGLGEQLAERQLGHWRDATICSVSSRSSSGLKGLVM